MAKICSKLFQMDRFTKSPVTAEWGSCVAGKWPLRTRNAPREPRRNPRRRRPRRKLQRAQPPTRKPLIWCAPLLPGFRGYSFGLEFGVGPRHDFKNGTQPPGRFTVGGQGFGGRLSSRSMDVTGVSVHCACAGHAGRVLDTQHVNPKF